MPQDDHTPWQARTERNEAGSNAGDSMRPSSSQARTPAATNAGRYPAPGSTNPGSSASYSGRSDTSAGSGEANYGSGNRSGLDQAVQSLDGATNKAAGAAGEATDRIRTAATDQLSSQKDKAVQTVSGLASSLHSAAGSMEGEQAQIAEYVRKAADQLEQFSRNIEQKNVGELITDVESFARRQPAIFLGAAFGVGLLAARFLKSSSRGESLLDRGAQVARSAASTVSEGVSAGMGESQSGRRVSEEVADPLSGGI